MITITEEQKNLILKNVRSSEPININGINYFTKCHFVGVIYSEVIAEKLARELGLRCAPVEAVKINGEIYFLSQDLNSFGKFVVAENLKDEYIKRKKDTLDYENEPMKNSLYSWWHVFAEIYPNDVKALMDELIKIYLFDNIIMNYDRTEGNWGVIEEGGIPHIYIFDNECLLNKYGIALSSSYDVLEAIFTAKKDEIDEQLLNLFHFLEASDLEYLNLLEEMLRKITPEKFLEILNAIEEEYQDKFYTKDNLVAIYTDNYNKIMALIEKRGRDGQRIH